jgi:hypothetical protein
MGAAGGAALGAIGGNAALGAAVGAGAGLLGGFLYDQSEKGNIDYWRADETRSGRARAVLAQP